MRAVPIAIGAVLVAASLTGAVPASASPQAAHPTTRLLVKMRPGDNAAGSIAVNVHGKAVHGRVNGPNGAGIAHVNLDQRLGSVDAADAARQVAQQPGVLWAVPDRWVTPATAPNDPSYAKQWGLSGPYGVRAESAWPVTVGQPSTTVAVIDTGYLDHADLSGQFLSGYDMVSCDTTVTPPDCSVAADGGGRDADAHDPGDSYIDASGTKVASSWHGTHVNGIIAALQNNNLGVSGLAPGVKIEPIRALGSGGGWLSDIVDALTWAVGGQVSGVTAVNSHPARVVNMSLEAPGACDVATQTALDFAYDAGAVVVVAAGNDGVDAAGVTPAGCRHVITVGATTAAGVRASYSNFGSSVDLSAPGGDGTSLGGIYSTYNKGQFTPAKSPAGDSYQSLSGTSMATPFVSAAVALMLASDPTLTVAGIYGRLRDPRFASAFASGSCDPTVTCGAGILNTATLVGAQMVWGTPVPTSDGFTSSLVNASPSVTYSATSDAGVVTLAGDAGGTTATVTGLAPSQSATVTVTASVNGVATGTSTATAAALCSSPVPAVTAAVSGDAGWQAQVSNYDAAPLWQVTTSAGTVALSSAGTISVTGLSPLQSATVHVSASVSGCSPASADVAGAALPAVTLSPVAGFVVGRSRSGFRVFWSPPPAQNGRTVGVRVRLSRVNSTRYTAWVVVDGRSYWRTPALRHGRYRIQIVQTYGARFGQVTTRRASF